MNDHRRWLCLDCSKNTFEHRDDWYFLRNRLWRQLVPRSQRHGMICRACIERRLGRRLTPDDFRKATDDESEPEDRPMEKEDYGIIDSLTPQTLQAIDSACPRVHARSLRSCVTWSRSPLQRYPGCR